MYADHMTDSMMRAISETNRRRALQEAYNEQNGITPQSVQNAVRELLEITKQAQSSAPRELEGAEREALMAQIEDQMLSAAQALDFETAAKLRDQLFSLKGEKTPGQKEQPKRRRRGR